MNKRLFSIVLILTMVVFLFAGCGKNKPSTDGTLIGTWRCDESSWNEIVKVDGVIVYEDSGQTIYPETEEGDGNFTREFQPYYQITSDKFKLFLKLCFNNVPAELDLPEGYFHLLISKSKRITAYSKSCFLGIFFKRKSNFFPINGIINFTH